MAKGKTKLTADQAIAVIEHGPELLKAPTGPDLERKIKALIDKAVDALLADAGGEEK